VSYFEVFLFIANIIVTVLKATNVYYNIIPETHITEMFLRENTMSLIADYYIKIA